MGPEPRSPIFLGHPVLSPTHPWGTKFPLERAKFNHVVTLVANTESCSLVYIHVKIKEFIFYVNTAWNFVFIHIILLLWLHVRTGISIDRFQSHTIPCDFLINFLATICDDLIQFSAVNSILVADSHTGEIQLKIYIFFHQNCHHQHLHTTLVFLMWRFVENEYLSFHRVRIFFMVLPQAIDNEDKKKQY